MDIASTIQSPELLQVLRSSKIRCGGCGAKVGASILSRALRRAQSYLEHTRQDVLLSIGDDCAVLQAPPVGAQIVQTIDYVRSFISDPYLLGQIAAIHALSGMVLPSMST